jgi:hypothetical protein
VRNPPPARNLFNPSEEVGDDDADGDDSEPLPLQQGPDNDSSDDDEDNSNTSYNPDSWTPLVQRVHGLRPKKGRDYSHLHANIVHYAMTQYSLKMGLHKFKSKAEEAVSKELMQLHLKDTFIPKDEGELTDAQKKGALESLMLLKEKRDGSIKGRACADGRKQHEGATKGNTTSPTISLEVVLITSTINAFEGRDVTIVDVLGAFLTADMDEDVFMCLRGPLTEIMVKPAPEIYHKYVYVGPKFRPTFDNKKDENEEFH